MTIQVPVERLALEERIQKLTEECAEISQVAMKILRFGMNSYHPDDPHKTKNHLLLEKEIADLLVVLELMIKSGDINEPRLTKCIDVKMTTKTLNKWLKHNEL